MANITENISDKIKSFFFNTIFKQGAQTVLKEAAKILGKLKAQVGPINFSPMININSNNGITLGENWRLSVTDLTKQITAEEKQEMVKFNTLLMETFTKAGGAMKSTAYAELERNVLIKEAREAVADKTYRFILEKIPVEDRSTWLAALIIKHKMSIGQHALANVMQQQILLTKSQTGLVITNLMMNGFLENSLQTNYDLLTSNGHETTGEKQFLKFYRQVVHDIPKSTNAWGYSAPTPQAAEAARLNVEADVRMQAAEKTKTDAAKQVSLAEQIEKAKVKIENLGNSLGENKASTLPKTKDLA